MDCFSQLSRYIVDLSREHFGYLAYDPPGSVLNKIPPELPSFLDNTPASRELRSAYVQHLISKTLTWRIFQPFLFTLRDHEEVDEFLETLSIEMRQKSVRREAFWRQQTLKAAYTTPDAKQSISIAANAVVREIVEEIRYFADPRELEGLVRGVRRIVKLAVETWRRARIERELIVASFFDVDDRDNNNAEWEEYGQHQQLQRYWQGRRRRVVLRTFPRILREAGHEGLMDDQERVMCCIYSRGIQVYDDSPVMEMRLDERSSWRDAVDWRRHERRSSGRREVEVYG